MPKSSTSRHQHQLYTRAQLYIYTRAQTLDTSTISWIVDLLTIRRHSVEDFDNGFLELMACADQLKLELEQSDVLDTVI